MPFMTWVKPDSIVSSACASSSVPSEGVRRLALFMTTDLPGGFFINIGFALQ